MAGCRASSRRRTGAGLIWLDLAIFVAYHIPFCAAANHLGHNQTHVILLVKAVYYYAGVTTDQLFTHTSSCQLYTFMLLDYLPIMHAKASFLWIGVISDDCA